MLFLGCNGTRRWRWRSLAVFALSALTISSCGPRRANVDGERQTPDGDPAGALRQRAEHLWQARLAEDWATVFRFREPAFQEGHTEADFAAWSQENEPLCVKSFAVKRVLTDLDLGWVEITHQSSARRYPDVPSREVVLWEKWRRTQGQWYPVPREEQAACPASPALRDAAEEARLRARFEESWSARQQADWHQLYLLTDPRDWADAPESTFADLQNSVRYLAHEVRWVEVLGDRGQVRVVYNRKLNDPSMTKMPPADVEVSEWWVRHDESWYLDLKRQ